MPNLAILADIAEIAFEVGQYDQAIRFCEQGLDHILPLHAQSIRFYCTMIKSFFMKDKIREAENYF